MDCASSWDKDEPEEAAMHAKMRQETLGYVAAVLMAHPEYWGETPDITQFDPYPTTPEDAKCLMDSVARSVARLYKLEVDAVLGYEKSDAAVMARQDAWLICSQVGFSLSVIAKHFGGRDHSTVLHGIMALKGKDRRRSLERAKKLVADKDRMKKKWVQKMPRLPL